MANNYLPHSFIRPRHGDTLVIPELRRQKQEVQEFEAILSK